MNEELREALDLLRFMVNTHAQYGGGESEAFELVRDVVERSVDPPTTKLTADTIITPEMIAGLLPDWAAGMAQSASGSWHVYERIPKINNHGDGWSWTGQRYEMFVNPITSLGWRVSWTYKPNLKLELLCPECGCDAHLIESAYAGGGTYRWLCRNDDCGARGGRKPTKAEARASAEVKR